MANCPYSKSKYLTRSAEIVQEISKVENVIIEMADYFMEALCDHLGAYYREYHTGTTHPDNETSVIVV